MRTQLEIRPTRARRRPRTWQASIMVEDLESRMVLSTGGLAPPVNVPVQLASAHAHVQASVAASVPLSITGINITSVVQNLTNGVLTAVGTVTGSLLGHNFTAPLTATITPPASPASCPVLDLDLGPINLSLLGLNVSTSPICLDITANQGQGLLGDLLCGGLSGILQTASAATAGATGSTANLTGLLSGTVNSLLGNSSLLSGLNSLLGQATSSFGSPSVSSTPGATCNVLNLQLAPINLNLLGLNVHLDNCSGGPVTVNITATQGGGILGDLLCSVSNLLSNGHASTTAVNALLRNIIADILAL